MRDSLGMSDVLKEGCSVCMYVCMYLYADTLHDFSFDGCVSGVCIACMTMDPGIPSSGVS